MSEGKLELDGEIFFGKFKGELKVDSYRYSGDTHDRHKYFWKGQCVVENKKSGEKVGALFATVPQGNCNFVGSLERAVLSFSSRFISWPNRPVIKEYAAVVDVLLGHIVEEYAQLIKNADIIIPEICIPQFDIDELAEKGFVTP